MVLLASRFGVRFNGDLGLINQPKDLSDEPDLPR